MVTSVTRATAITAKLNRLTFDDENEIRVLFSELVGMTALEGISSGNEQAEHTESRTMIEGEPTSTFCILFGGLTNGSVCFCREAKLS